MDSNRTAKKIPQIERIKLIVADEKHPAHKFIHRWDAPEINGINKTVEISCRNDSIQIEFDEFEEQAKMVEKSEADLSSGIITAGGYYYQFVSDPSSPSQPSIGTKFSLIGYNITVCSTDLLMFCSVLQNNAHDKFYEPNYNYAIRIKSSKGMSREEGDRIFERCSFEYASSTGRIIEKSNFYRSIELDEYDEAESPILRPLEEWNEAIRLFNSAMQAQDPEIRLLGLYKVIEFFAEPILSLNLHEQITRRLESPDALKPSGSFIKLIVDTVKSSERRRSDKELIRNAFVQGLDMVSLQKYLPQKMRTADLAADSKREIIDKFASDIADIAVATRNQFAHAKSNYVSEGKECLPQDLLQFNIFMYNAAVSLIRWYNRLPEHQKSLPL